MNRPTKFRGRVWTITDGDGQLINDIDTDMIFHNAHLAVTDIDTMGQYAFGNLKGWEDLPNKVKPGDIIITGSNFGAGSSRQHAVDCFAALGIIAIVAISFGAIYKRNAINSGMPILTWPALTDSSKNSLSSGDIISLDLMSGILESNGTLYQLNPFSKVQMDIYKAGNLFALGST